MVLVVYFLIQFCVWMWPKSFILQLGGNHINFMATPSKSCYFNHALSLHFEISRQILIPFAAADATTSVREFEVTSSASVVSYLLLSDYVSGSSHFIYLFPTELSKLGHLKKKIQCLLILLLFLLHRLVSHLHKMYYVQSQPTCTLIQVKNYRQRLSLHTVLF